MDKLFLTGVSGFLGKHIFERWQGNIRIYGRGQSVSQISKYEPDYIIHGAAEIYKDEEMFDSNVTLTYKILEEARKVKNLKGMVYVGSSSEYGLKDHPIKESDVLEPFHVYAATKGAATLISLAYAHKYKIPVMIARPFSLYGEHEPKHRLIPTAIKSVKAGWPMKVSKGMHDFIHVDDFIDGIFLMLNNPAPGEIFNFGTGIQRSNEDVVKTIEKIVGRKVKRKKVDGLLRPFDTNNWVCDYAKANKKLGWEPKTTFYNGVKELCHI